MVKYGCLKYVKILFTDAVNQMQCLIYATQNSYHRSSSEPLSESAYISYSFLRWI